MALIKTTQLENGYQGDYIRIESVIYHQVGAVSAAEIRLGIYKDKEARRSGKSFAEMKIVNIADGTHIPVGDSRAAMYRFLKTLPDYQGSQDDIDSF